MAAEFYTRLRQYYCDVAEVLKGKADAAKIFPNPTDIGQSREQIYATFLQQHAPSRCNVFYGGYVFHSDGTESKQLDVIVTTDTAPRFDFHNPNGSGKSFSPVEGTLGVFSIKSTLDKAQLYDALYNIASVPPMEPLTGRMPFSVKVNNYEDWPYKVVYATAGLSAETASEHLNAFYRENPQIPICRRPHIIHVAGQYAIMRIVPGIELINPATGTNEALEIGKYFVQVHDPDLHAIVFTLDALQQNAAASAHIFTRYQDLINRVL